MRPTDSTTPRRDVHDQGMASTPRPGVYLVDE